MTEGELRQAIAFGREQRGVEFKGPGKRTDRAFQAKVIRAILGMANKPGGGVVVIGVDDDGAALQPTGLSTDELSTWSSYDDLATSVSTYADPYVDFDIATVEMDGKSFVAIEVTQFKELPVICKRDYQATPGGGGAARSGGGVRATGKRDEKMVLRNGALYVRRRGKNETIEVPSHVEMREVLRHAAEFVARDMVASHVLLEGHVQGTERTDQVSEKRFDAEVEDLV